MVVERGDDENGDRRQITLHYTPHVGSAGEMPLVERNWPVGHKKEYRTGVDSRLLVSIREEKRTRKVEKIPGIDRWMGEHVRLGAKN